MSTQNTVQMTLMTADMLCSFDISDPRYTLHPTADRFVEAFTEDGFRAPPDRR